MVEKKEQKEKLGFWGNVQKGVGLGLLLFIIYFHLYVRPINLVLIAVPFSLLGIDLKKIIR